MKLFLSITLLFVTIDGFGQVKEETNTKHSLEIFPVTAFFNIYSVQYVYSLSEKDYLIAGFTYLNNYYPNKEEAIGRYYAPTFPIGYRRLLWRNLNIEGQLWPAYDFYKNLEEDKFYNGFDLAGSVRFGYLWNIKLFDKKFYTNIQLEYIFGIYGGNKPDNFNDVDESLNVFPALSIGYRW